MPPDPAFREMIGRLRAGDPSAAAELLKHYEPEVRRYIRVHLMSPRLHRFLDSGDIFQSVLAAFFVNVVDGQFDLDEPEQLIKLLVTMARHKIVDYARKPDQRRAVEREPEDWDDLAAPGPRPSEAVARQELLERVAALLTDEERQVIRWREDGRSWQEIADVRGGSADAARKLLARALDRVLRQLGGDGDGHG